jgi:hypothetical protein
MLLRVSDNKPSSGNLLLCFPKLMFIKIVSKTRRYEFSAVVWLQINTEITGICELKIEVRLVEMNGT